MNAFEEQLSEALRQRDQALSQRDQLLEGIEQCKREFGYAVGPMTAVLDNLYNLATSMREETGK